MPPEENAAAKEWDFHDYLELAQRRKNIIIVVFLLTFIATAIYQFTRVPVYNAFSSFTIDESANTSGVGAERSMSYYYWMQQSKPVEYYQAIVFSQVYTDKIMKRVQEDSDSEKLQRSTSGRDCRRCSQPEPFHGRKIEPDVPLRPCLFAHGGLQGGAVRHRCL